MECDTVFIWLSNKTVSDFEDMAHFINSLKYDSTCLKEISTKDVTN